MLAPLEAPARPEHRDTVERRLKFVRVDGDLVRVSVRGEGPALLLIMGLGGNIEMWDPLEQALNARGIQTIAYDASGTGRSPPRLVPKQMKGLARQAAHLLYTLGYPCADVLGVSFGGAVAQQLALSDPDCVDHLVLTSTMCGVGGVPGNPFALSLLTTPLRYYSPAFLPLNAGIVHGPGSDADNDVLQDQTNSRRTPPPTAWGYLSQLAAAAGWTSLPWLHRLHSPTLVLAGDADEIVPPSNSRILASRIPNAQLEIVPGAGHLLLTDQPDLCATTIANFLGRPLPGRSPAQGTSHFAR